MKRCSLLLLVLVLSALPLLAQTGNGAPSGAHYNLNIIGVDKNKTADMTNSDRHTIFVALKNSGDTYSNIYLTQGDFQVCDGNAFDAAYDCSGNKIQNQGAVFQLPSVFCARASNPLAVLSSPVVLLTRVAAPIAVFRSAVLKSSAPAPTPVL